MDWVLTIHTWHFSVRGGVPLRIQHSRGSVPTLTNGETGAQRKEALSEAHSKCALSSTSFQVPDQLLTE